MPLKCRFISKFPIKLYGILSVSVSWHNLIFRSITNVRGDTPVDTNANATDGELFVRKVVNGEKISEIPEYLMFTAPYKICEGGCNDSVDNIVLSFPLYVGKRARQGYRNTYHRDAMKLHSDRLYAPFAKKTTRVPYTTCRRFTETPTMEETTRKSTVKDDSTFSTIPPMTIVPTKADKRCPPFKKSCKSRREKTITENYAGNDETTTLVPEDDLFNYLYDINNENNTK